MTFAATNPIQDEGRAATRLRPFVFYPYSNGNE